MRLLAGGASPHRPSKNAPMLPQRASAATRQLLALPIASTGSGFDL
ncbi:hypothetical protein AK812_SmicGene48170, partial [Symbiodinium microadriaticum]